MPADNSVNLDFSFSLSLQQCHANGRTEGRPFNKHTGYMRHTHATHDKLIRSAVDGERTKRIRTLRAVVGGGGEVGADKK